MKLIMAPLQQSGDSNANHDGLIIGVVTVVSVLSLSARLMRLTAKQIKQLSLDWDDYLAIGAWVCIPIYILNEAESKWRSLHWRKVL